MEALAVALSPLIALQVSAGIERTRDAYNRKLEVLETLMATRHAMLSDDRIRALNKIIVLFADDQGVLDAHRALMDALSKPTNPDGSMPTGLQDEWNERQWDLVSEIGRALNVTISKEKFVLGYAPRALSDSAAQQQLLLETNKSLMSFARMHLGLPWDPAFLYTLKQGVGIVGPVKPEPTTSTTEKPPGVD